MGTDSKKGHFQGSYRISFPVLGGLRSECTFRKRLMQAKKVTKSSGLQIDLCDRVKLPFSKYKGNSQIGFEGLYITNSIKWPDSPNRLQLTTLITSLRASNAGSPPE